MNTGQQRDAVIAGGGPAGLVMGYLLARAGLAVTVLEKHTDFLRDFRGDTIHPSTITLLGELGLRERFLQLPLTRVNTLDAVIDGERLSMVDFSALPPPDNFLVLAPQWEFLNFVAQEAQTFPGFDLRMGCEATEVITEQGTVVGVHVAGPEGDFEIRATLTVAADGRDSVLREALGLVPKEYGVPIDVLWFRLPKKPASPPPTLAYVSAQGLVLALDRGDYYQSGSIIPKGNFGKIKSAGLEAFRQRISAIAPPLAEPAESLLSWDQLKLLSVQVNRLPRWHRPGFMAIGDAAHAMSPMFGVGVNFAIQDAVALANAITEPLSQGVVPEERLKQVQQRREVPVAKMQRIQRFGHRVIGRRPAGRKFAPRWVVKLLSSTRTTGLRRINARRQRATATFIGIGFLPEHPQSPT